jgi:hypothetical protein
MIATARHRGGTEWSDSLLTHCNQTCVISIQIFQMTYYNSGNTMFYPYGGHFTRISKHVAI